MTITRTFAVLSLTIVGLLSTDEAAKADPLRDIFRTIGLPLLPLALDRDFRRTTAPTPRLPDVHEGQTPRRPRWRLP